MPQFTKKVSAGSRMYFFDVQRDRNGDPYVTIAELGKASNKRSRIFLHREDYDKFIDALAQAVAFAKNDKIETSPPSAAKR